MLWTCPAANWLADVVNEALPLASIFILDDCPPSPAASGAPLSMKVTVPPGVPPPDSDTTVATNVNFAAFPVPTFEGMMTELLLLAGATTSVPLAEADT